MPVDKSMKGSGASGTRRCAAPRSPPCSGAGPVRHSSVMAALLTLGALLIEAVIGYPVRLLETVGHPVMWLGWLIDASDRTLNRAGLGRTGGRVAGAIAIVLVVATIAVAAWGLQRLLLALPLGPFAAALAASTLLAQ